MAMSPYLKNKVMEHVRGISTYTPPTSTFFRLLIGLDFDTAVEVVAADYDPIEVDNGATAWTVAANEATNDNAITFSASPANDWTTGTDPEDAIRWLAEYDASSGGNLLTVAELLVPLYVTSGGPPVEIPIGSFKDRLVG